MSSITQFLIIMKRSGVTAYEALKAKLTPSSLKADEGQGPARFCALDERTGVLEKR